MNRGFLIFICTAVIVACLPSTDDRKGADIKNFSEDDRGKLSPELKRYVLSKAPEKIQHRLNAKMGEYATILGYDIAKNEFAPGETIEVTWYWQCHRPLDSGWQLFTHLLEADGTLFTNRDDVGTIRNNLLPSQWKPGMIIKDVQPIETPEDWTSDTMEIRVGIWLGNDRISVVSGPSDNENRVNGPVLKRREVILVPEISIPKIKGSVKIDGKLQREAMWDRAIKIAEFKKNMDGSPARSKTELRLMWDDRFLYLAMIAEDTDIVNKIKKKDVELWREDAFGMLLKPNETKTTYYDIQVSSKGIVYDARLPEYRAADEKWNSRIKSKVSIERSTGDNSGDGGKWILELAMPFSSIEISPPKPGDVWRANFFRTNVEGQKTDYYAWSPPMKGDFHAMNRLGKIIFSE
ncbi:MAG: carbohydrate-binding family 9-like protein [Myxococcota bacterium]|nr:carbohydrate-binding family 9-like protein [Myxococcota bacterium]